MPETDERMDAFLALNCAGVLLEATVFHTCTKKENCASFFTVAILAID